MLAALLQRFQQTQHRCDAHPLAGNVVARAARGHLPGVDVGKALLQVAQAVAGRAVAEFAFDQADRHARFEDDEIGFAQHASVFAVV